MIPPASSSNANRIGGTKVKRGTPTDNHVLTYDASLGQWQGEAVSTSGDGWTAAADTWTYASASTFTISGVDRTTVFTKGTRLKFTQTTDKYAVVVGSSFSTNTTVTIAVNTDYTIANAAITSPYYSYQLSPQGYPGWFAWSPTITWTGGTPPSGTPTKYEKFKVDGNTLTVMVSNYSYTAGSGNTGANFASPVTASGVQGLFGNIRAGDTPGVGFAYCLAGTFYVFCSSTAATGIILSGSIVI